MAMVIANRRRTGMKSTFAMVRLARPVFVLCALALACLGAPPPTTSTASSVWGTPFDTPQQAADALLSAAEQFNVPELLHIFGPEGHDIVLSGEFALDRKHAADFAAQARKKMSVSVDPKSAIRAFVLAGDEDWPLPVPLVKRGAKWFFDSKAGQQELKFRRIGANELDAIEVCHGYVEAQHEYATQQRSINETNQYAQRIVSTPGKHDGLAWKNEDGTWGGPIGENIARAIEQGYTSSSEPYHGYFFKILKGQGPSAPLGEMDFVVKRVMIGGFALVAAPAEYNVTGVRTFIVSHDGVDYEKDLGPGTLEEFNRMDRFNPDKSWTPVPEQ
jgi:hypothetical protein